MRIAFASIDGTYIDQHLGNARYFQIFDLSPNGWHQVDSRRAQPKCRGNCNGGFDHLLSLLNDCDAIFAVKIGQGASAYMIGHGKRVFEAYGPVEEVIEQFLSESILEEG